MLKPLPIRKPFLCFLDYGLLADAKREARLQNRSVGSLIRVALGRYITEMTAKRFEKPQDPETVEWKETVEWIFANDTASGRMKIWREEDR